MMLSWDEKKEKTDCGSSEEEEKKQVEEPSIEFTTPTKQHSKHPMAIVRK